jgi:hypothetical protein
MEQKGGIMILFGFFCLIVACATCPLIIVPLVAPFIYMIGGALAHGIYYKIKYGYFLPWEHRDELKKKGIKI